ncbi:Adenylate kinase 2 [Coemansia javaensis]|uniref:GTP:AMP phosphotransferase, mitochondrial n=1 Tax=Coemansia javaensis TaxID=2761396 RepID=A0A9W8H5L0_9FUNG|nr:Adenylate kinase 2 [Coemansia javaensis]
MLSTLRTLRPHQHGRKAAAQARAQAREYQGTTSPEHVGDVDAAHALQQPPHPHPQPHPQQPRSVTRSGVPLRMLILGAPGAGKGTQSGRIRECFDVAAVSSGDVLRRNIAGQTAAGRRAQEAVARGALVGDDVVVELIRTELDALGGRSWLLDGFPRTLVQARALDAMLAATGQPLTAVINLDVPESVILQRIVERYVHVPSGRVYNLTYNPPRVAGVDDVTGEPLEHRPDDNPEVFRRRLELYHAQTAPLLEYYRAAGVLTSFSGPTSDIIYPQIHGFLDQRFE